VHGTQLARIRSPESLPPFQPHNYIRYLFGMHGGFSSACSGVFPSCCISPRGMRCYWDLQTRRSTSTLRIGKMAQDRGWLPSRFRGSACACASVNPFLLSLSHQVRFPFLHASIPSRFPWFQGGFESLCFPRWLRPLPDSRTENNGICCDSN